MNKSLFEELAEFTDELVLLLKQDWEKTKKFIREHKNYFLWLVALFIGAQFTDIITLGQSWDNYCKKNGIQNGGVLTAADVNQKMLGLTNQLKQADAEAKTKEEETNTKEGKKDSMFKKGRKNIAKSLKNNPVFGNLNYIFSMTTSMFSLALVLLAIVGILSLPVILFIIITYCVIKSLLNKLAIL